MHTHKPICLIKNEGNHVLVICRSWTIFVQHIHTYAYKSMPGKRHTFVSHYLYHSLSTHIIACSTHTSPSTPYTPTQRLPSSCLFTFSKRVTCAHTLLVTLTIFISVAKLPSFFSHFFIFSHRFQYFYYFIYFSFSLLLLFFFLFTFRLQTTFVIFDFHSHFHFDSHFHCILSRDVVLMSLLFSPCLLRLIGYSCIFNNNFSCKHEIE